MTWSRPPVPVPVLELPRAESVVWLWDAARVRLNDSRVLICPFSYHQRLDDAPAEAQHRVVALQWGLVLVWPDVPYYVSIRRLLIDAKAGNAPWGDPPTVIP